MNSKDLIGLLKENGFVLVGTRGSHHKFKHPDGRTVTVPHPKKDLPVGTVRNIFRQVGLDWR